MNSLNTPPDWPSDDDEMIENRAQWGSALDSQARRPERQLPRTLQRLAGALLRLAGWRVQGGQNIPRRAVIIAGPHTSNHDFLIMVGGAWSRGVRPRFLAKHTLFRPPLGWLMRLMGGVSVDRRQANGLTGALSERLMAGEGPFALLPGGSRKARPWKSGFVHIAAQAKAPVYLLSCNYAQREMIFYGPYRLNDQQVDTGALMRWVQGCLYGVQGKHPAQNDLLEWEKPRGD